MIGSETKKYSKVRVTVHAPVTVIKNKDNFHLLFAQSALRDKRVRMRVKDKYFIISINVFGRNFTMIIYTMRKKHHQIKC